MLQRLREIVGGFWPDLTWGLYGWLSKPAAVTLALLVVVGVMLLARQQRFRRRMIKGSLTVLVVYWVIISPLFSIPATYLLVRFAPPDTGESADAIVVLARAPDITGDRYDTAVTMVDNNRANSLLIMGRYQSAEVLQELDQRNIDPALLLSVVCAGTTKQEAALAAAALEPRGLKQIILITDPIHMLRAWLTFKSLGFSVIPHAEPLPEKLASYRQSFHVIREYLGLASYAALGRFERRSSDELPEIAEDAADMFPLQKCLMNSGQIRQNLSQR